MSPFRFAPDPFLVGCDCMPALLLAAPVFGRPSLVFLPAVFGLVTLRDVERVIEEDAGLDEAAAAAAVSVVVFFVFLRTSGFFLVDDPPVPPASADSAMVDDPLPDGFAGVETGRETGEGGVSGGAATFLGRGIAVFVPFSALQGQSDRRKIKNCTCKYQKHQVFECASSECFPKIQKKKRLDNNSNNNNNRFSSGLQWIESEAALQPLPTNANQYAYIPHFSSSSCQEKPHTQNKKRSITTTQRA